MTDCYITRINQFLGDPCLDIHGSIKLLEKAAMQLDIYKSALNLLGEEHIDALIKHDKLLIGIRSIIIQCRQSTVLGEDARAVADELEILIAEGCDG